MSIYKQPVSDQRIAFEAWYSANNTAITLVRTQKGYVDNTTRVAWRAWQAATVIASEPAQPQQEIDWKDMYEKQKRRAEMWIAKYEADIGLLEKAAPVMAQPQQEPVSGCVCRWNSEGDRTVTCERHQGWLDVIAEWADRARNAEKKLKVQPQQEPVAGMVLVPYEPCFEMQEQGSMASDYDLSQSRAKRVYQAMIDMHQVFEEKEPSDEWFRLNAGYTSPPQRVPHGITQIPQEHSSNEEARP